MTQEELRAEYQRLFYCETIKDCNDLIDIFSNFLLKVSIAHHGSPIEKSLSDAEIVLQMMLTKTLYLKKLIEGVSYDSTTGTSLNNIIDPTVVATLTRNIYETVCVFHLVYISPKTEEEKKIIYNLWVLSGLNYRQRFKPVITITENKKKQEEELKEIEFLVNEIRSTKLYNSFDEKDKSKVEKAIKNKDYKLTFENNKVNIVHWHKIVETMGVQKNFMDSLYAYLSLYAHPSNVSVFQFQDMFKNNKSGALELTSFNLTNSFMLLSIFISDYITLFPEVIDTYNLLPITHQIALNSHNFFARGKGYSINDSWKVLG